MRETLRSLFGKDWRKSQAHLLLLSKFLRGQEADRYDGAEDWTTVLGQPVQKAIRRFVDDGMLVAMDVAELAGYRLMVAELRSMLKESGLPVSGRKAELISRLIANDRGRLEKAVAGPAVLRCTAPGKGVVEEYLAAEEAKKYSLKTSVYQMLQGRRYRDASLAVAKYEAAQVFPRGINIDWGHYDPGSDELELRRIFEHTPKTLGSVSPEKLAVARIAAGMMLLIGSWSDIASHIPQDADYFYMARMLLFHAYFVAAMKGRREPVEIHTCNDDQVCPACRELAGRKYAPDEVPELPYEKCTSKGGCRCQVW